MTDEKRSYQMTKRAENQAQTRQRILESTLQLHATIGPARTTIIAVAKHAGVPRSTVYRHFQDEAALIVACEPNGRAKTSPPTPAPGQASRTRTSASRLRSTSSTATTPAQG